MRDRKLFLKIYLSGPMTIDPHHRAKFDYWAKLVRARGHEVISPPELGDEGSWNTNLRRDIRILVGCDLVLLLPDWSKSRGSTLEASVAAQVGIGVREVDEWLKEAQ